MSNLDDAPADDGGSPTEAAVVDDVHEEAEVFLKTGASTYKDRDAAVKGITALEAEYRRAQNALAEKERLLAQLQSNDTRDKALAALVEKVGAIVNPGETQAERDAARQALEEEIRLDPGAKVVDLYSRLANATGNEYKELRAKLDKIEGEGVGKQAERIHALEAKLAEMELKADPVYQENRATIDELAAELKVDRAMAMRVFTKVRPEATSQRQVPPGATGGGRFMGSERTGRRDTSLDAETFARFNIDPAGAEAKELRAKWDADYRSGRASR